MINQFHNKQNILPTYFYVFFILLNEMFLYGNFFIKLTIFHLSKTKSENGEYYRKNEILVSELAHSLGQSLSRINTSLTQILYGTLQKKNPTLQENIHFVKYQNANNCRFLCQPDCRYRSLLTIIREMILKGAKNHSK